MQPVEVKALLERYGFRGLHFVTQDEATLTFTFKFESYNDKYLGVKPTVAGGGKVAVYAIPEVGKVGISPSNSMVRFIAEAGKRTVRQTDDSHLGHTKVSPELTKLFHKSAVSTMDRHVYLTKLWTYFNDEKFQGRMTMPKLLCTPAPPGRGRKQGLRGLYMGAANHQPGTLWVAPNLFNAREPFFLEVFLHEMCHQAVWTVDRVNDFKDAEGHGKYWQAWMTKVGLDPRRYDPTDDSEYMTPMERSQAEDKVTEQFGPRVDTSEIEKREHPSLPETVGGGVPCVYVYKSRAINGVLKYVPSYRTYTFLFPHWKHKGVRSEFSWPEADIQKRLKNLYKEH